jgi:hypothetical protein
MLRISTIVLALAAFITFAPADAFAFGWAGHGGGGWGGHGWGGRAFGWHFNRFNNHFDRHFDRLLGFGRFGYYRRPVLSGYPYPHSYYYGNSGYDPGCVWIRQLVPTPYGPQWRMIPGCAYR